MLNNYFSFKWCLCGHLETDLIHIIATTELLLVVQPQNKHLHLNYTKVDFLVYRCNIFCFNKRLIFMKIKAFFPFITTFNHGNCSTVNIFVKEYCNSQGNDLISF